MRATGWYWVRIHDNAWVPMYWRLDEERPHTTGWYRLGDNDKPRFKDDEALLNKGGVEVIHEDPLTPPT